MTRVQDRLPRARVLREAMNAEFHFWRQRIAGWPWWIQVSLLYAASRLYSLAVFLAVARQQGPNPWTDAHPDYLSFIGIWDSAWYQRVYLEGYPAEIPRGLDGRAVENQWAFYALFPGMMRGPGGSHRAGLAGVGPAGGHPRRICGRAGDLQALPALRAGTALWAVAFVAVFPVSPILQVPYAESLNLALLAAALLLVQRKYLLAVPVVVLMCLSRPVGVPFAVLAGLHLLWRIKRRRTDPLDTREFLGAAALALVSCAAAVAWPVLAWSVTGEPTAYTDTESAWRGEDLVLFRPWFDMGVHLFGPVGGMVAPLLLVAAAAWFLCSAPARSIGLDLRLWCACYLGYLLAFLHPQTSTFRLMLPLFPLALAAAFVSRSRAYRSCVAVMFLAGQIVWVPGSGPGRNCPAAGTFRRSGRPVSAAPRGHGISTRL